MQTPENTRFTDYVTRTTRPPAQAKRLAMFSHLDGHEVKSAVDLAARVAGNTKDRAWISQAIRDGEIVIMNGTLRLPEAVAAAHPARSLPRLRDELAKIVDELEYVLEPEDEEGRAYWVAGIGRLVTGSRLIGCAFDLDDVDEEWKDHSKAIKRYYKRQS